MFKKSAGICLLVFVGLILLLPVTFTYTPKYPSLCNGPPGSLCSGVPYEALGYSQEEQARAYPLVLALIKTQNTQEHKIKTSDIYRNLAAALVISGGIYSLISKRKQKTR